VLGGLGVAIISTSKGIMTDRRRARRAWAAKSCASSPEGEHHVSRRQEAHRPPKGVEFSVQSDLRQREGPEGHAHAAPAGVESGSKTAPAVGQRRDRASPLTGTTARHPGQHGQGRQQGFERKLELVGVGYRAAMQGKDLSLRSASRTRSCSRPRKASPSHADPDRNPGQGRDKQRVGQVAAKIRAFRPPEPYKGKGVKYSDETIIRKEAKKA
jgi:large subunit ribosomal protein L6